MFPQHTCFSRPFAAPPDQQRGKDSRSPVPRSLPSTPLLETLLQSLQTRSFSDFRFVITIHLQGASLSGIPTPTPTMGTGTASDTGSCQPTATTGAGAGGGGGGGGGGGAKKVVNPTNAGTGVVAKHTTVAGGGGGGGGGGAGAGGGAPK